MGGQKKMAHFLGTDSGTTVPFTGEWAPGKHGGSCFPHPGGSRSRPLRIFSAIRKESEAPLWRSGPVSLLVMTLTQNLPPPERAGEGTPTSSFLDASEVIPQGPKHIYCPKKKSETKQTKTHGLDGMSLRWESSWLA